MSDKTFLFEKQIRETLKQCLDHLEKSETIDDELVGEITSLLRLFDIAELTLEKLKAEKIGRINKLISSRKFQHLLLKVGLLPRRPTVTKPKPKTTPDSPISDTLLLQEEEERWLRNSDPKYFSSTAEEETVIPKVKTPKRPTKTNLKQPPSKRSVIKKNLTDYFDIHSKNEPNSRAKKVPVIKHKTCVIENEVKTRQWNSIFKGVKLSSATKKKIAADVICISDSSEEDIKSDLKMFLCEAEKDKQAMQSTVNYQASGSKAPQSMCIESLNEEEFCDKYFDGVVEEMKNFFQDTESD